MELTVSNEARYIVIGTFVAYTVVMFLIGYVSKKVMDKTAVDHYMEEFYTGGRGMGALALAMMVAAGLCSAGTFLGGPGMAYQLGATWVMVVTAQCFMNFLILGTVGKKIGIVSRRIGAQSFMGLLMHRYNRNVFIAFIGILSVVGFMGSYVVAQFVGGARLFESMTGLDYKLGLVLFAVVVIIIAVFGGIKGVALAVVFQGLVMTVAVVALAWGTFSHIGNVEEAFKGIAKADSSLLDPWKWPLPYQISMWMNFGLVLIGIPHSTMGTLTYKNTQAMHKAIVIGAILVTLWSFALLGMGLLVRAIYPALKVSDHAIPILTMTVLPPWLAGVTIAGVAGAIQSTVAAMIIIICSAIVKDLYQTFINPSVEAAKLKKINMIVTGIVCLAIFAAAIQPPHALQVLIIFAVGGLASTFFWPLLLGVYWMKTNEYGALAGMLGGLVTYILTAGKYLPFDITFGMHAIAVSFVVSGVLTTTVSLITPKSPYGVVRVWFGAK
ncbi:sodium/panthothenate symporter [Synergistales bacterium]|nr:sodium/panthothenate symporter [Synergistales bacterium]